MERPYFLKLYQSQLTFSLTETKNVTYFYAAPTKLSFLRKENSNASHPPEHLVALMTGRPNKGPPGARNPNPSGKSRPE